MLVVTKFSKNLNDTIERPKLNYKFAQKEVRNTEIAKTLKISKSTVRKTIKRFNERGDPTDRLRCGRPRTARTSKKVRAVLEKIRCLNRLIGKMAKEYAVPERAMRRLVKEDLKKKSLSIQTGQS